MPLMRKRIILSVIICFLYAFSAPAVAQERIKIKDYIQLYALSAAGDNAPFWLVSNRNGVPSLDTQNGSMRYGVLLDGAIGDKKDWRYSAAMDVKAGYNNSSDVFIQQLNAEVSYKWLTLSAGTQERSQDSSG